MAVILGCRRIGGDAEELPGAEDGGIRVGPLFIMEKKNDGALPNAGGWNYTVVAPDGSVRTDAALQTFCNGCHVRAADDDYLMFMPDEFRLVVKD